MPDQQGCGCVWRPGIEDREKGDRPFYACPYHSDLYADRDALEKERDNLRHNLSVTDDALQEETAARLAAEEARDALARDLAAARGVFRWLLGEEGDFPTRGDGEGAYYWRAALQANLNRAGLLAAPRERDLATMTDTLHTEQRRTERYLERAEAAERDLAAARELLRECRSTGVCGYPAQKKDLRDRIDAILAATPEHNLTRDEQQVLQRALLRSGKPAAPEREPDTWTDEHGKTWRWQGAALVEREGLRAAYAVRGGEVVHATEDGCAALCGAAVTPMASQWDEQSAYACKRCLAALGRHRRGVAEPEREPGAARPCTCHPDDNPPRPCPQKYALSECRAAAQGSRA